MNRLWFLRTPKELMSSLTVLYHPPQAIDRISRIGPPLIGPELHGLAHKLLGHDHRHIPNSNTMELSTSESVAEAPDTWRRIKVSLVVVIVAMVPTRISSVCPVHVTSAMTTPL